MEPAGLIRKENELLAATGAESAADLADHLWAYVDGVVTCLEDGIDLQSGFLHEALYYPFTLQELKSVADQMEASEVPVQAAAGDDFHPGEPGSPSGNGLRSSDDEAGSPGARDQ